MELEFDRDKFLNLLKEYVRELRHLKQTMKVDEVWVDLNSPNIEYFIYFLPHIKKLTKMKIHLAIKE